LFANFKEHGTFMMQMKFWQEHLLTIKNKLQIKITPGRIGFVSPDKVT